MHKLTNTYLGQSPGAAFEVRPFARCPEAFAASTLRHDLLYFGGSFHLARETTILVLYDAVSRSTSRVSFDNATPFL